VSKLEPDSPEARKIDADLSQWRQGDVALEEHWFFHVGDPSAALTDAAAQSEGDSRVSLPSYVDGLAVITQTCDLVRRCVERPFVEVAPLVRVNEEAFADVVRGRRPAYAALPELHRSLLVVDLDRVMSVEKSIVARWKRAPGYVDDADARAFAHALARKRERFAFPDDFVSLVRKLESRLIGKHEKATEEGRALRALREIRVQAEPSWDAEQVELMFWFIRSPSQPDFEGTGWDVQLSKWLDLVPENDRFIAIHGQVVALEDMNAAEYVQSAPFDLDHLSSRRSGPSPHRTDQEDRAPVLESRTAEYGGGAHDQLAGWVDRGEGQHGETGKVAAEVVGAAAAVPGDAFAGDGQSIVS
jgi:hypothetical protein